MDIKKEIRQILNNHSLPTDTGGFIRDNEGQFNKVAKDLVKLLDLDTVRSSIFNEVYDKWIELNDDSKFISWLNKNCK